MMVNFKSQINTLFAAYIHNATRISIADTNNETGHRTQQCPADDDAMTATEV